MIGRFLEDFAVGQTFRSGRVRIDTERIKTFGAEFDPQPFHFDEEAARDTIFRGLAASGWHTAAVTMRLLVESDLKPAGGIVGAGADEFRWPRPVRPGDEIAPRKRGLEGAALEVTSRSGTDQGANDDAQPERRSRSGHHGESRGIAPPDAGWRGGQHECTCRPGRRTSVKHVPPHDRRSSDR